MKDRGKILSASLREGRTEVKKFANKDLDKEEIHMDREGVPSGEREDTRS